MRELIKLIKKSVDVSMQMRRLKRIGKSLDKRRKMFQAYKREMFATYELVKRYNERYPNKKLEIRDRSKEKGGAE